MADGTPRRATALAAEGIDPPTLARALKAGTIERVSRGTYRKAGVPRDHRADLAAVSLRLPRGTACLLTAAHLHGLLAAAPIGVWLALPNGISSPTIADPPTKIHRWAFANAFAVGIETTTINGVEVPVTSPARTVIDLLRYARLVGGEEKGIVAGRTLLSRGGRTAELREIAARTAAPAAVRRVIGFLEVDGGEVP